MLFALCVGEAIPRDALGFGSELRSPPGGVSAGGGPGANTEVKFGWCKASALPQRCVVLWYFQTRPFESCFLVSLWFCWI